VLGQRLRFEDVIPARSEDAEYKRLPDEAHDGRAATSWRSSGGIGELQYRACAVGSTSSIPVVLPHASTGITTAFAVKEGRRRSREVREIEGVWFP